MKNEEAKIQFKRRLYKFVLRLIEFVGTLNKRDVVCKVISDQLTRSGCSVLANYVEGLASRSKKELATYFSRSLMSANESRVWVGLLRDSNKCNKKEAEWLLTELVEIANIFGSSVLTLKGKK